MNDSFLRFLAAVILGGAFLIALEYTLGTVFLNLGAKLIYTSAAIVIGYLAAKWI